MKPRHHRYRGSKSLCISLMAMTVMISPAVLSSAALSDNSKRHAAWPEYEAPGEQVVIEGEITRVQGKFVGQDFSQMKDQQYRIKTAYGKELNLHVGDHTQTIGQIYLGDRVKARASKDGMLYTVQKISQSGSDPQGPMVRRRIVGTIKRVDGQFVFLQRGDRTEIVHMDDRSQVKGTLREGVTVAANLGDAGYAVGIEEVDQQSDAQSASKQEP